ncbi:MAG: hypothetical protein JTJ10_03090, partial [Limosilactobacillus mucosae]|nr:hypothetical protein [Limosilactobacillus mucosae]
YKESVIANMQEIGATSAEIDKVTEAIEAMEEASSGSSGGGGSGGDDSDAQAMGEDDGSGIGKLATTLTNAGMASGVAAERMQQLAEEIQKVGESNEELHAREAELCDQISNGNLTTSERISAMTELGAVQKDIAAGEQEMSDKSAEYLEILGNQTDATEESKQIAVDTLTGLTEQYGISYDEIFSILDTYINKGIETNSLSSETYTSMSDTVALFAESVKSNMSDIGSSMDDVLSKAQQMAQGIQDACNNAIQNIHKMKTEQAKIAGYSGSASIRYATGVLNAATTHIAITDEQGPEIKMRKPSAGNYSLIERGSSVIPAQPSANIWKMGIDPDNFISQHMPQRSIKSVEITQPDASGVSVSVGDIQMYGVNDVESFGRVIHERVGTIFAQEFSRR